MDTSRNNSARRADAPIAAVLFLGGLAAYWVSSGDGFISDARHIIDRVIRGETESHQVLHGVFVVAYHRVVGPLFGDSAQASLSFLSALFAAGGLSCIFLASRTVGARRGAALFATLLVGLSSAYFLHGTVIEEQSLVLLPTSAATLWCARAWRRGELGDDALVPTLWLLACGFTHLAAFLVAPAVALMLFWGREGWRIPRRLVLAAVVGIGSLAGYMGLRSGEYGPGLLGLLVAGFPQGWSLQGLWRELLSRAAFLLLPCVLGIFWFARRCVDCDRRAWWIGLTAAAPLLSLYPTLEFDIYGGYFLAIYPLLGLGAAVTLNRMPQRLAWIGAALVLAQGAWTLNAQWQWRYRYEGHEWLPSLVAETNAQSMVFAREYWEMESIWCHSRLYAMAPRFTDRLKGMPAELVLEAMLTTIENVHLVGGKAAVLRTLLESENETDRHFVEGLIERFGEPRPGERAEYVFLDP